MTHRWVETQAELHQLLSELVDEPRYALDTEFHRERTYFPKAALVQIGWPGGIALIDPLAVDLRPMAALLDGPGLAVLHAAQQDLEVLSRACGTIPSRLFDTQIAAGFVGYSTPSLASLLQGELAVKVLKGDRLTDWLRRPLTDDQRTYAAADVAHLLDVHDVLLGKLVERGRHVWVDDECELFRLRPVGPTEPEQAWLRIKDVRTMRGANRSVARSVAAWRERRASTLDQPVRFVLPDLAILGIAQKMPRTLDELRGTRGVEDRHSRSQIGEELLAAVDVGVSDPDIAHVERDTDDLDRNLRPAVTLVSAWVSQLARDEAIDTTLLATRSDLVELLSGAPDARLGVGWRAAVVGDGIRRLVGGEAALAFDGQGRLRLVNIADA